MLGGILNALREAEKPERDYYHLPGSSPEAPGKEEYPSSGFIAADEGKGGDSAGDPAVTPAVTDITQNRKPKDLSTLDFEERVEHLKFTVVRNPTHREILYKALRYCDERHLLAEVEGFIASCPEFGSTGQSPYHLLMFLVQGGGIDLFELDSDGEVILPQQKDSLTEDEIDDLVVGFAFETNEYGRELVERMSPRKRLLELLEITPEFYDSFIEVLEFLTEKRTMADIDTLLRGRDVLKSGRTPGDPIIQPSVFVDKLEKAGGICWEAGWIISDEGQEVLRILKERKEGEPGKEEEQSGTERRSDSER